MTTLNREDFLTILTTLQPGLTQQEVVEQSSCFVFNGDRIMTYNEEIACTQKSPLKITGAVRAAPLLNILAKLPEEEVTIEERNGELIVSGKRRKAGLRMEGKILLPVEHVERPKKWRELPEEFCEAVGVVEGCASKDAQHFSLTCIHIHPERLEACDNYQGIRYKISTNFKKPMLARRDALKHIVSLGMNEVSETDNWVHFKNPHGLIFSCRRSLEEYHDIDHLFKVHKKQKMSLPKGLSEAADKAQVFSAENSEDKDQQVCVELRQGRLRIKGQGASGWYSEVKKISYDGPSFLFYIDPKLLIEITSRHTDCVLDQGDPPKLVVDGGKFIYSSCLGGEENGNASNENS